MKNFIKLLPAALAVVTFSSCSTIFHGGSPKIFLDGTSPEPVTITTKKKVYENVTLPTVVKVKRHKINGQRISIESPNYKYSDILLEKKVDGWTWGNIVIGGIPGWIIDMATNSVSTPKQTRFNVVAQPK